MSHPLVRWLTDLHRDLAQDADPAKRLRPLAEQALLRRHQPEGRISPSCCYDLEPFPCFVWRTVAAGWGWAAGFDPAWFPTEDPTVDLDYLTELEGT